MTMRTYRHFVCQNGHPGIERTSENDQPYSAPWESISVEGMIESNEKDKLGYKTYLCSNCRLPMKVDTSQKS